MKSSAEGFDNFLKSMLKDSEEEKELEGTRLGSVIEVLKTRIESDFEQAEKGFSSKCDCLSCRCMVAVEEVIDKEFQAKGEEYKKQEKRLQKFIEHSEADNLKVAIAISNTTSTLYDVLGDIMKKHCANALCFKIAESRGYMKI